MNDSVQTTPAERLDMLAEDLTKRFSYPGCELFRGFGELTLVVPAQRWSEVALELRDRSEFRFEHLMDLCGVDFGAYGQSEWDTEGVTSTGFGRGVDRQGTSADVPNPRFAVAYHLLSVQHNTRLRIRVYASGELPIVDSVVGVWRVADWYEREAFDLYGILFDGHPDLRRILTDYGFVGHPFRKDFPLIGQVEMRYDPDRQRVVYEPVAIEPRTLVPKVIRTDNRYFPDAAQDATDA